MNIWILALLVLAFWGVVYACVMRLKPLEDDEDVEMMIQYNESILKGRGGVMPTEDVSSLYEHPTVVCRWSDHRNHGGPRPAVWQKDMEYPVCKHCLIEDPYM